MEKLAIIGTGIAGMGAAYFLNKKYDITLYEKNNYVGGHTNTVNIKEDNKDIFVDTGFMVFNKVTYPNLTKLFEKLNVDIKPTAMSFSVNHIESGLEYSGSGLNGLFAQRKNIFNLRFIRMLYQINRFNSEALETLSNQKYSEYSLAEYVDEKKFGNDFLYRYLIPMSSAVWSSPPDLMLKFPAKTLVRFFHNHGFLGLDTQHQWYTVVNGSQSYRNKIIEQFKNKIHVNNAVQRVIRENGKIKITSKNDTHESFDKVIFASHADETLKMLDNPTEIETQILHSFKYQFNKATLHTDYRIMPKNKKVWSSWNYRIEPKNGDIKTSTIYYMNSLQQVSDKQDYFLSINDPASIDPSKIIMEIDYEHPVFDLNSIKAQKDIDKINMQQNNTFFCGSYFKYGFHEDAFTSALELSKKLLGDFSW
ncbi:MAG: NADP transhydrogenase subunit alpha [Ignavibacteriae bacterium HGW-Ignavibacteriae-2]|jgi:predicted NAD/FAD-binding protein|nr:MAG: NADP transhydrogenase subunit alpha [Ignavibacteriae bacterium HGW-Ignavibacteriae-2]